MLDVAVRPDEPPDAPLETRTEWQSAPDTAPILEVRDLHVQFRRPGSLVHPVRGVSWDVRPGEVVALVGESGCGKSVSALAVMRLLPEGEDVRTAGRVLLAGREIESIPEEAMRRLRGPGFAMIFQEPMTSLNPLMTIGSQIAEPMRQHLGLSRPEAAARALDLLRQVALSDPERRLGQYPHELSGGMRQRVMIAIALACEPRVIIADEPTTALDVTIQAQILELLVRLARERGTGLVLITHNLGLVARHADRINVMYAGRVVEAGPTADVLRRPKHRYTAGLLAAVPRLDGPRHMRLAAIPGQPPSPACFPAGCPFHPRCEAAGPECRVDPPETRLPGGRRHACVHPVPDGARRLEPNATPTAVMAGPAEPILSVRGLTKHFPLRRAVVRAVEQVDLDVPQGGTLGLVGESGCGKTSVARTLLGLERATGGRALLNGKDMMALDRSARRALAREIQVVYQDPYTSLNPSRRVGAALAEPLLVHGLARSPAAARERVEELLVTVGLPPEMAGRYPHQMSGGQRQRVGIARALGMEPRLIVCDEPVSALDVSIQAQIVNLLADLKDRLGLSYLFIAHDLAVVRHLSDVVAVMYLGRIVETGTADELFAAPRHPYTRALLAAVPSLADLDRRGAPRPLVEGELPSAMNPPSGCVFHTRCPLATAACRAEVPATRRVSATHSVACIRWEEAA